MHNQLATNRPIPPRKRLRRQTRTASRALRVTGRTVRVVWLCCTITFGVIKALQPVAAPTVRALTGHSFFALRIRLPKGGVAVGEMQTETFQPRAASTQRIRPEKSAARVSPEHNEEIALCA